MAIPAIKAANARALAAFLHPNFYIELNQAYNPAFELDDFCSISVYL